MHIIFFIINNWQIIWIKNILHSMWMIRILLDIFKLCEFFTVIIRKLYIFCKISDLFIQKTWHTRSERHRHNLRSQLPPSHLYNLFFFTLFYFDSEHLIVIQFIVASVYDYLSATLQSSNPSNPSSLYLSIPLYSHMSPDNFRDSKGRGRKGGDGTGLS